MLFSKSVEKIPIQKYETNKKILSDFYKSWILLILNCYWLQVWSQNGIIEISQSEVKKEW